MSVNGIRNILFAVSVIANLSVSNAQNYIGISGGYCKEKFLDFSSDQNYDAKYNLKNGMAFSSFYETNLDSTNFRIELQYKIQNADMEIRNNAGNSSFYTNLNYSFQQLNLNLIYSFRLFEKKSCKIFLSLGPTMAYTINTKAEGNGWNFVYLTQIDTNSNPVQILTTRSWEKNERNSKDLSGFNFGFDMGMDFIIPINDKLDFILQNKYNVFLTNITTLDDLRYTSLFTGHLNIGIRYNLHS